MEDMETQAIETTIVTTEQQTSAMPEPVHEVTQVARPVPQDYQHKKSGKTLEDGRTQVEARGRTWIIEPDALDDVELYELLDKFGEQGQGAMVPKALRGFLGEKQKQEAYEIIRNKKTGRISFNAVGEFLEELLNEINPN